jgi:predicted permease
MFLLLSSFRHVFRRFSHAPVFTLVAIITLAVGIGANTAIFSVINGVLLKPLPFAGAERLVGLWHTAPGVNIPLLSQSPATYFSYREEARAFEDVGMWDDITASVTGVREPEEVEALRVTDGTLPILRVVPILGRLFTKEDDAPGSPRTTVLCYNYWQRVWGGDRDVIGKRVTIDGELHEIIGVLPERFRFLNQRPALLLPFRFDRAKLYIGNFSFQGLARLKDGATIDQAKAEIARLIPRLLDRWALPPGMTRKMLEEARLGPVVRPLKQDAVGDISRVLWILMGTVGLVLLIACANVANLFLVRAEARQQELAVRTALGADWKCIARELLFESMTLSVIGGLIGLFLAYMGLELLLAVGPASIPRLEEISVDPLVLLFTLAVSLFAGLLFGLIPVVKYARPNIIHALKEGGRASNDRRDRHRARNALVVTQIALAMILLVGAGLMIRTFQALQGVQPGFIRPEEVLTLRIFVPSIAAPKEEESVRMHERIMQRLQHLPGVTSVGLSSSITMDGNDSNDPVFVEDHPVPEGQIPRIRRYKWISENFFETMGRPLLAGRAVTWVDIYNYAPIVMVSENFAREYWGAPAGAIGKRIRSNLKNPWREIVGVVANEYDDGVHEPAPSVIYFPMLMKQHWDQAVFTRRMMGYAIRSQRMSDPAFLKEVQQAVWSVNPNLPLAQVQSLKALYRRSLERTTFTLILLGIAALVALLLGVVGIYGVIAYAASQRSREIGIRMALGARQQDVSRLFVRHGLVLIAIGLAAGLVAAAALTRLMAAVLFGVAPLDPLTFVPVAAILGGTALLASYLPARRAARMDPVEALHRE